MKMSFFSILSILIAAGCSTSNTKLTEKGAMVKLISGRPSKSCSVIDKVMGEDEKGSTQLATNHAKNLSAKAGANAMVIDREVKNGAIVQIIATAYHCL